MGVHCSLLELADVLAITKNESLRHFILAGFQTEKENKV